MYFNNRGALLVTLLFNCVLFATSERKPEKNEDVWEQDLSDAFKIDPSTQGVQKVNLKCGADSMYVQLQTEEDFTGVMYTRGSFYEQSEPCFVKPKNGRSRSLEMSFSFENCQTNKDGEVYSNVVVVQHDPELVTPGDSAFSLECDFRKPRNINLEANFQARDSFSGCTKHEDTEFTNTNEIEDTLNSTNRAQRTAYTSRITLASPDPGVPITKDSSTLKTAQCQSDSVEFVPSSFKGTNQKVYGTVESVPVSSYEKLDDEL